MLRFCISFCLTFPQNPFWISANAIVVCEIYVRTVIHCGNTFVRLVVILSIRKSSLQINLTYTSPSWQWRNYFFSNYFTPQIQRCKYFTFTLCKFKRVFRHVFQWACFNTRTFSDLRGVNIELPVPIFSPCTYPEFQTTEQIEVYYDAVCCLSQLCTFVCLSYECFVLVCVHIHVFGLLFWTLVFVYFCYWYKPTYPTFTESKRS